MLWAIRDIPAGHPVVLNYNEFVDSYFEDEHKPIEAAQEATEQEKAKEGTKPNQREEDEEKEGGAGNESDATTTSAFANIPQNVGRV